MGLTKAQLRSAVQAQINDDLQHRFGGGRLDVLIELTQDSAFTDILDIQPWYNSQNDVLTATLTAPGFVDLRVAASGGDLTKRVYRLQSVVRNGVQYSQVQARNVTFEGNVVKLREGRNNRVYVRMGDQLHLLPYNVDDDVEVRYNFLPVTFTAQSDGFDVEWPEGHDDALVYEAALRASATVPPEQMVDLKERAAQSWSRLLGHIERLDSSPLMASFMDTPESWGGE